MSLGRRTGVAAVTGRAGSFVALTGFVRQSDAFDEVTSKIPGIVHRKNPNIIVAPRTASGITELHVMLASLLPDAVLRQASIERPAARGAGYRVPLSIVEACRLRSHLF